MKLITLLISLSFVSISYAQYEKASPSTMTLPESGTTTEPVKVYPESGRKMPHSKQQREEDFSDTNKSGNHDSYDTFDPATDAQEEED